MSKHFFIGDTHFFHKNIIKYCNRPYASVEEMNEALIANWNKVVSPADKVIHVGDFSFANIEKSKAICNRLNGFKILVRGNHDKPTHDMLAIGFDFVVDSLTISLPFLGKILVSHYPIESESARLEILNELGANFHVHGHVHNGSPFISGKKAFNVSVETIDYAPIEAALLYAHALSHKHS